MDTQSYYLKLKTHKFEDRELFSSNEDNKFYIGTYRFCINCGWQFGYVDDVPICNEYLMEQVLK